MFDKVYPKDPASFKDIEIKTLEFLRDKKIPDSFDQLLRDISTQYSGNRYSKGYLGFNFESYVDLTIDQVKRRVYFGGLMTVTGSMQKQAYENISYYFAICESNQSPCKLLRKFHFDCALSSNSREKPHPFFHLQYAGKLSNYLKTAGFLDKHIDHMEPGFSEPRIINFPITLALLLNIILIEAEDAEVKSFLNTPEWRKLTRDNEVLLLKKYYKTCCDLIMQSSQSSNESFILDHCYAS